MAKTLRWQSRITDNGQFMIQSEHVRGEGVSYILEMGEHDRAIARRLGLDTVVWGRGGVSRLKAVAQQIVDAPL